MKKTICLILMGILMISVFSGCISKEKEKREHYPSIILRIYCDKGIPKDGHFDFEDIDDYFIAMKAIEWYLERNDPELQEIVLFIQENGIYQNVYWDSSRPIKEEYWIEDYKRVLRSAKGDGCIHVLPVLEQIDIPNLEQIDAPNWYAYHIYFTGIQGNICYKYHYLRIFSKKQIGRLIQEAYKGDEYEN